MVSATYVGAVGITGTTKLVGVEQNPEHPGVARVSTAGETPDHCTVTSEVPAPLSIVPFVIDQLYVEHTALVEYVIGDPGQTVLMH